MWTTVDIYMPDSLDYPGGCHVYESAPESLVSLQGEDELQICGFRAVVQKTIVPDLLEPRWKYMHEVASYELLIIQHDLPAWITGFSTTGTEGCVRICNEDDTAV